MTFDTDGGPKLQRHAAVQKEEERDGEKTGCLYRENRREPDVYIERGEKRRGRKGEDRVREKDRDCNRERGQGHREREGERDLEEKGAEREAQREG